MIKYPSIKDFDYCPSCKGSFSFSKPDECGNCPWCKKNVEEEYKRSCE